MDGWMDRWMDGWMDGWMRSLICYYLYVVFLQEIHAPQLAAPHKDCKTVAQLIDHERSIVLLSSTVCAPPAIPTYGQLPQRVIICVEIPTDYQVCSLCIESDHLLFVWSPSTTSHPPEDTIHPYLSQF